MHYVTNIFMDNFVRGERRGFGAGVMKETDTIQLLLFADDLC